MTIGPQLDPSVVNVVGSRQFGRRDRDFGSFVVIPRLDAHDPKLANFGVHQNGRGPTGHGRGIVHHWGQPGLIRRNPTRGSRLERLAYKGHIVNLDADFQSETFRDRLSAMGIVLDLDVVSGDGRDQRWGNYEETDLVFAVRNLTQYDAMHKPASKLTNSWFAEVPALLGPEPAFRELRKGPLDYIEVRTTQYVIEGIALLRDEPRRFADMVANGRARRDAFSTRAITKMWVDLLDGPIADAFARWKRRPYLRKIADVGIGMVQEPLSKRRHQARASGGRRILDD